MLACKYIGNKLQTSRHVRSVEEVTVDLNSCIPEAQPSCPKNRHRSDRSFFATLPFALFITLVSKYFGTLHFGTLHF